ALTEAAQTRLTWISGSRDDLHRRYYVPLVDGTARGQEAMLLSQTGQRSMLISRGWTGATFAEDLYRLMQKLRAASLGRVIVIDLTRPEFRIPVVRVLIPGLEDGIDTDGYRPGDR